MTAATPPTLTAGLVAACDDDDLFAVELTPAQRGLLAAVERGDLLHLWALGRRSGKSLMMVLTALWLCLLRPDLAEHVRRRERRYSVFVATNARQSRLRVEEALSIVEASPILRGLVESSTDDELRFRNRSSLVAFACTSRGVRGWPVMGLFMDESAHFLDGEGNSAAESVYRSLAPSVAQFGEAARIVVASSPFGCDGWFHDTFRMVEKGDLPSAGWAQASTLEMRPGFSAASLELERRRDPEGYRSEYLAEFVAAGGAFLDASRVAAAAMRKGELRPGEVEDPEAAIDLGLVADSTALAIVGRDRGDANRQRLVLARSWKPDLGPLGFSPLLDEIADICLEYGVRHLYTDQYSASAAVEHLARRGVRATVSPTTAQSKSEMFASLKTRLYGGGLELYEQPELLAELNRIETVTTPGQATVRIRRLGSSHGDIATAVALVRANVRTGRRLPRGSFVVRGSIAEHSTYAGHPRAREAAAGLLRFGQYGAGR